VIAAGRLFHLDRFDASIRLTARDAATGKELWKNDYPTDYEDLYGYEPGPRCSPVVDGERVLSYGPEGRLVAWSVTDGQKLWEVDTRSRYRFQQNFFGVGSSPVVDGPRLLVAVGGSPPGARPADFRQVQPAGSAIVAFDKVSGKELYRTGQELASYSSPIVATVGTERLGLYFARGGLFAFHPETGQERFRFPWRSKTLESVNASNPVVLPNRRILITECYENGAALLELEAGVPKLIWSDRTKERGEKSLQSHWCTPVADGTVVYGCHGRHPNEAELRCVDATTGDVLWRERRTSRCTLIRLQEHLLSMGEAGELRLFRCNSAKYDEVGRWRLDELEYPCWAPPAAADGRFYLRGRGKLVAYSLAGS
jgi:outer membrane protein assembly factor BamB